MPNEFLASPPDGIQQWGLARKAYLFSSKYHRNLAPVYANSCWVVAIISLQIFS
jgi:hypothetical protein